MQVILWCVGIGIGLVILGWAWGTYLIQKDRGFIFVIISCPGVRKQIMTGPHKGGFLSLGFYSRKAAAFVKELRAFFAEHASAIRSGGVHVKPVVSTMYFVRANWLRSRSNFDEKYTRQGSTKEDVLKYILDHLGARPQQAESDSASLTPPATPKLTIATNIDVQGRAKKDWRGALNK